jgi:hypothetical protein
VLSTGQLPVSIPARQSLRNRSRTLSHLHILPERFDSSIRVCFHALLAPVAMTIYAGRLDLAKLSWFQKWISEKVKSPVGVFRDWTAIAARARVLPAKMGV